MDLSVIKQATQGLLGGVTEIIGKFKIDPTRQKEMETEITKAVLEHEAKMLELTTKSNELAVRDRESARNREVSLRNTIGAWTMNIVAAFIIIVFGVMLFVTLYTEIPAANKDIYNVMLGSLGTIVMTIVGYWFGSSANATLKDSQINEVIKEMKKRN